MKRIYFIAFIAAIFSITSCSKDDDHTADGPIRLARVKFNGFVAEEYTYNNNGQLTKLTAYSTPSVKMSETILTYDPSGKLTKTSTAMNISSMATAMNMDLSYDEYAYQNDLVTSKKTFLLKNGSYQQTSSTSFDYDANKRVIAETLSEPAGQPYLKTTYQYDGNGNATQVEIFTYSNGVPFLSVRRTYEYDNKLNPPQSAVVLPFSVNKNNITKETASNPNIVPGMPPSVTTISYEYNGDGYPSKSKINGVERVYEYNR